MLIQSQSPIRYVFSGNALSCPSLNSSLFAPLFLDLHRNTRTKSNNDLISDSLAKIFNPKPTVTN